LLITAYTVLIQKETDGIGVTTQDLIWIHKFV